MRNYYNIKYIRLNCVFIFNVINLCTKYLQTQAYKLNITSNIVSVSANNSYISDNTNAKHTSNNTTF